MLPDGNKVTFEQRDLEWFKKNYIENLSSIVINSANLAETKFK